MVLLETSLLYIYYRNMPVFKFTFHLISPPKIYPAPFLFYYPQNKTLLKTGEILPKAYLEGYYGIIRDVALIYTYYRNMPVL